MDTGFPLRKRIEKQFGKIPDELFYEALEVTRSDVRANFSKFGKRADFNYVYFVTSCYLRIVMGNESQ
ncbi:MAG: hypothetical protein ACOZCL_12965 [Bacillota bacterium]